MRRHDPTEKDLPDSENLKIFPKIWFLAVQNSSIGLIVCPLVALPVCLSDPTNNQSLHNITEWSQRLVTFETFDQSDEKTWPDQKSSTYLPAYLPTYITTLENTIQELVCQWHFHFSCIWAAVLFYTFDIYRILYILYYIIYIIVIFSHKSCNSIENHPVWEFFKDNSFKIFILVWKDVKMGWSNLVSMSIGKLG